MARIADYDFPLGFLGPMALILTVSMMIGGIVFKGTPDAATADHRTVAPYFELEPRPTGMTLPLRPTGVTAGGTALLPGSVVEPVSFKPNG